MTQESQQERTEGLTWDEGPEVFSPTKPRPRDLLFRMSSLLSRAIDTVNLTDERVDYLVSPTLMPGEQGHPLPAFGITLAIPSMLINQQIQTTAVIGELWASQEDLEGMVRQMLEGLLKARSEQSTSLLSR